MKTSSSLYSTAAVALASLVAAVNGATIDSTIYTNVVTGLDSLGNDVEVYYRLENLPSEKLPAVPTTGNISQGTGWSGSGWATASFQDEQDGSTASEVNAVSMKLVVKGSNQQWLGLGLSPSGMVGGEVVLGTSTSSDPQLYGPITAKNGAGVPLSTLEEGQASIIEAFLTQDSTNDETTLMVTRTLNGGSLEFDLTQSQILIWGASSSAFPSYHGTGRGSVTIDWTLATKPTASTNLPSEDFALLPPDEGNNNEAEEEQEPEEEEVIVVEDDVPEVEAAGDGFSTPIEVDPNVRMQQRLINSQTGAVVSDQEADAIEFILSYTGSAWLALGVNPAGRLMPGSEAIIGKPLEPNVEGQNPAKYIIGGYSSAFIDLAPQQTLINATIVEEGGVTTLRFTKLLQEDGEHEIFAAGDNNFVFAVGTSASFPSIHQLGGTQQFQLNPSLAVEDQLPPAAGGARRNPAVIFIAHGIMALIAWAFMAPFAAAASALRGFFPEGPMWFQFHRGLNMMTILITITAFITAVAYGGPRFNNPHYIAGWVIFFASLVQASLGIFRPHVNPDAKFGFAGWWEQIQLGSIRAYWELAHKVLGYGLLAITIWQMSTGINLLAERYQTPNYITAYWGYIIAFWALLILGKVVLQFRSKGTKEATKDVDSTNNEKDVEEAAA